MQYISLEVDTCSPGEEIPCLMKVNYHVHKSNNIAHFHI